MNLRVKFFIIRHLLRMGILSGKRCGGQLLLLPGLYSISVAVWSLRKFIAIGFLRRRGSDVAALSLSGLHLAGAHLTPILNNPNPSLDGSISSDFHGRLSSALPDFTGKEKVRNSSSEAHC